MTFTLADRIFSWCMTLRLHDWTVNLTPEEISGLCKESDKEKIMQAVNELINKDLLERIGEDKYLIHYS